MAKFKKGQSGNPDGRPKGTSKAQVLLDAIATVEKRKKKKFLIRAVEQAYDNPAIMTALLKKIIPDLKAIELTGGEGNALRIIVEYERNGRD